MGVFGVAVESRELEPEAPAPDVLATAASFDSDASRDIFCGFWRPNQKKDASSFCFDFLARRRESAFCGQQGGKRYDCKRTRGAVDAAWGGDAPLSYGAQDGRARNRASLNFIFRLTARGSFSSNYNGPCGLRRPYSQANFGCFFQR